MSNEYVSTSEAAEELGITRQRVLQLINQGRLEASRLGNTFMISKAALANVADRTPGRPKKEDIAESPPAKARAKSLAQTKPTKKGAKK